MEKISIYKPDNTLLMADVPVTDGAEHTIQLMKEDKVTLSWSGPTAVTLPVGAYITYGGIRYSLMAPYYPETKDAYEYVYKPEFHHEIFHLQYVPFLLYSYDAEGNITQAESDWTFTGNIQTMEEHLVSAIKEAIGVTYSIEVDEKLKTATKTMILSVNNMSVLSAINQMAEQLECEWWYRNGKIYFTELYVHSEAVTLKAGEHVSIPSQTDRNTFHNRFYVFGSTRNIPQDYKGSQVNTIVNKRLTLNPTLHPDGYIDLPKFDGSGNVLVDAEGKYIKDANAPKQKADGSWEHVFAEVIHLDSVYPHSPLVVWSLQTLFKYVRDSNDNLVVLGTDSAGKPIYDKYPIYFLVLVKGKKNSEGVYVADLDASGNPTQFFINDSTYDAEKNPNGSKIKGLEQELHFSTGSLQGREFKFGYYPNGQTKKRGEDGGEIDVPAGAFEVIFTQDNTIIVPNATIAPKVGDNVIAFNIKMPEVYTTTAYEELEQEALKAIYNENKENTEYSVSSNPVWFSEHNPYLSVGRHVSLNIGDKTSDTRVTALTTQLDNANEVKITLSKEAYKGTITTLVTEVASAKQNDIVVTIESDKAVKEAQRQAYQNTEELRNSVFDTDGYFKDGNLRPETIETMMLSVGARSQAFSLGGFTMIPNLDGTTSNPNAVSWTNGVLTHFGFDELMEWNIGLGQTTLTENALHYIYAKCTLYDTTMYSQGSGTIEITTDKIQWNEKIETNNVYYFLIGTISSINSSTNKRVVSLTYGSTTINGEYVKTGVLQSNNGKVKIDLNTGTIYAKNGFTFLPSGSSTPKSFSDYTTETNTAITDVGNKIDNLQVGGNNVIPYSRYDTKKGLNSQMYGSPDVYSVVNDDEMGLCLEGSASIGNASACFAPFALEPNKEYTFSFYYKMCGSTIGVINALFGHSKASFIQLMSQVGTTSNGATIVARDTEGRFSSGYNFPKDKKWHRYWVVFKVDTTITSNYSELYIRLGSNKYGASSNVRWRVAKLQLEEGNKVTSWRCSDADIETQVEEVKAGLQQQIEELESQIDNEIEFFFGNNVPTLTNEPASSWTTEELKKAHVGDVYLKEDEGLTYKFIVNDGTYTWKFLENDPSAKAIALASQAVAEVGDKSTIIYGGETPKVPYYKGDMWSRGSNKPLLICITDGVDGKHNTYNSADWADAGEYIDAQARADALSAQSTADGAVTTANNVGDRLDNLSFGGINLFDGTADIDREIDSFSQYITLTTSGTYTDKEFVLSFDFSATSGREATILFQDSRYKENDGSWADDFYEISSNVPLGRLKTTSEGRIENFHLPSNLQDGNYHRVWIRYKQLLDWSLAFPACRTPIARTFSTFRCGYESGTIKIKNIKLETGSVASAWSPSLNDTNSAISALQDMVTSLENQVDGQIEYYTYNYVPTASNIPASAWTTDKLKKDHVGDIFYNTTSGISYKWLCKDNVYQWVELSNDPSALALNKANEALGVAEKKNMVIYGVQPTSYKKGDLWVRSNDTILVATQDSTTFLASHWVDATTYVDQTARDAANTANTNAGTALTTANTANSNASTALNTANTANTNAGTALTKANSAYNRAESAESSAKAYADSCQQSAESYAKAQADLAKKSAMDEIDNYAYLKGAMYDAEKVPGYHNAGLMLGSMIGVGKYTGDKTQAVDPALFILRAGMLGGLTDDDDSIAFWAGGTPDSATLPFRVLHNGSVRMTKAEITSGSTDGAKIQILDNAISIGSTDGTDTQILGISGNGVDNMYAIANGGSTSQNVTISAKNATKYDSSVKTIVNGSTTYAYAYSDRAEVTIPRISLINNTTSNRGVFTFGSVVFTESKGYETGYPTISGTTSYNTDSGADTWERYVIASIVDENGNEKAVFKNVGSLKGLKFVIEPNTHYYLVVTLTSQVKEKFKCKSEVSTDVVYSFKYYHSISVSSATDNQYIYQCFNNTLYKDGMFMSKDSEHWLGMSAHGNGSYSMFKLVNGNNSGFNVASNRLEFLNKNASGLIASPIPFVIWCGYAEWTSGTSVNVNTHTIASVTLSFEFVSNAHYKLKITGGATFSGKKLSVLFSAEDGYETMVSFTHSASDISSNGQAFITFKSIVGTQKEYNWWRGDVSWLNGSSAVMKKIGITIIAY